MNEGDDEQKNTPEVSPTTPEVSPTTPEVSPTNQFYKMLPRGEGTPSPAPTPVPQKQKFSSKIRGLFSINKKKDQSEENNSPINEDTSSPIEKFENPEEREDPNQVSASRQSDQELIIEEAEAPDYHPPAEPISEVLGDINNEIKQEEERNVSPFKAGLIAADVPDIDSPEDGEKESQQGDRDDDFQSRNVNESKAEFYEQNIYHDQPVQHKADEYDRRSSLSPSEIEKKSIKKEKIINFIKLSLKQTVLIGLVVAYAFVGSLLFQLLEQYNEMKSCQESHGADIANIVLTKAKLIEYVQFNVTSNALDTTRDNETYAVTRIEEMLTEYRDEVLNIGYSGCETSWNIINGFLFCLTVVTTIGYGQVFPKTWQGQIVCICYAIFGIPLFLACLANISTVLGFLFRWMYVKVCCGICNYRKKQKAKKESEGEKIEDRNQSQNSNGENGNADYNSSQARIVDDNEDLENEMNDKDDIENVSVPLTITILVVTAYILIGALIFSIFEDWKIIESAYFCFVTLTTIGFGDLVPGQNFSDPLVAYKLAAGCVYILLGLAILGMAFDLMQEELISKFTWFGKKIGLLDEEDEEEDGGDKKTASSAEGKNEYDEKKQAGFGSNENVITEKENY